MPNSAGPYIDLHTHTKRSDGKLTAEELLQKAADAGIGVLALTDHNVTPPDLEELQAQFPTIRLVRGAEVSCLYTTLDNKDVELHVVALCFDPQHPQMQDVLGRSQMDRRPYINALLEKLAVYGIDIGSYDALRTANPDSRHIGRMHLAKAMVERGYVQTIEDAFDIYLGAFGQRKAYVKNPLKYASLEEAVEAIRAADGVPVLAHLYYYQLSEEENLRLVRRFKELAGDAGAMEVEYGRYPRELRDRLAKIAEEYDLMPSAGSDYHAQASFERLDHRIPCEVCARMAECITRKHSQ
jgi:predicted metal-dependent phosphoesterase TrpH